MSNYVFSKEQEVLYQLLLTSAYKRRQEYVLMQGPPGSGKTFFATMFAENAGIPLFQMTGAEVTVPKQLFYNYDIPKMAAGTGAYQRTQLWNAVLESRERTVGILLDELDKTPESTDGALLQLFDTQRCFFQDPYGNAVQGNGNNMIVFLTSNGRRGFSPELMRRTTSVTFPAPDQERFYQILVANNAPGPEGLVRYVAKLAIAYRKEIKNSEYWPTPAEANRLLHTLTELQNHEANIYSWAVETNFSKNIGTNRWQEISKTTEKTIGAIGKAIKTEIGR